MKLKKNMRWVAIALGILGGSTSALACVVTPDSILTEGQTLQLVADCTNAAVDPDVTDDRVNTINWKMRIGTGTAETVTGDVTLAQTVAKKIYFTTPVGLTSSGTGEYTFSVSGTYVGGGTFSTADPAKVVVKPASAAVALALGVNSPTPINAACGSANGTSVQSMPTGTAQCNPGKGSLAISGPNSFTWSCLSLNGGTEANCFAYRGTMYTVTATDGGSTNGSVTPLTQSVNGGQPATVTATPAANYNTSWSSTCGPNSSGNTYTISSVNANCTVTASFSTAPPVITGACGTSDGQNNLSSAPTSPAALCTTGTASAVTGTSTYTWSCAGSNGGTTDYCSATKTVTANNSPGTDTGIGSGLWVPTDMPNRTVADQTGDAATLVSYVPGCLNNLPSDANGCGLLTKFEGTINGGTPHTVTLGYGNQLVVRYMSKPTAGSSAKSIKISSGDGSSVGVAMRIWLSTDPKAIYANVDDRCKKTSKTTEQPYIITGGTYCPIAPDTTYYLGIEYDEPLVKRFKINELSADFL